ncbi:9076_t:CDS:2 [Cetraspora pellucida]|uniref:9076_t:CDS:1 n=1 Tax=Cetraspora pellucida TaxID=1433469 RepID=A0A9N9GF72_9GLOM|nr:9076_t:CDS:2 [Cetraspora pellucida]
MPKDSLCKNTGPCVVCGKNDLAEKFRRLTPNLFYKALQSLTALNLKVVLSLYDQLCHKHYTKLVIFDRHFSPKEKQSANSENSDKQSKVKNCKKNVKKRPFSTIQSTLGQNKRFAAFGRESGKALSLLIMQHQLVTENKKPLAHVHSIQLDVNDESVKLNYQPFNKAKEFSKIDAIIRACDESLLFCDGYRKVGIGTFNIDNVVSNQLNNNISFEYSNNKQLEIQNSAFRSIKSILNILVPIWKQSSSPILILGDTIKLKLGGDSHNEKYEILVKVGHIFVHELLDLKNNGFFDHDSIR